MSRKATRYFKSTDGKTDIHVLMWYPDERKYHKPVGILQIAHGMIDHIERFTELAEYMAGKGFVVCGNDHLGHGDSVVSSENWGYFADYNSSKVVVRDMLRLTRIMKRKHPELPYFLLGHSMGSFMARRYAMEYGEELSGLLVLGTGNQSPLMVAGGTAVTELVGALKGDAYRSPLLAKLMFGSYNRKISDQRTVNDWLTTDEAIVDAYNADPKCTYTFTVNGNKCVLSTIQFINKKSNIEKIPSELPILFASGMEDPVGNYGKDVKALYNEYTEYVDDVELRLYEGCRHELHSETNRQQIFKDLWKWMKKRM